MDKLEKMQGPIAFPKLGAQGVRSPTPIVTTENELTSKILGQATSMRQAGKLQGDDVHAWADSEIGKPPGGAHLGGMKQGIVPSYSVGNDLRTSRRGGSLSQYHSNNSDLATQVHENFHNVANQVRMEHGDRKLRNLCANLVYSVPDDQGGRHLKHFARWYMPKFAGYGPDHHHYHEEVIARLFNVLNDSGERQHLHDGLTNVPGIDEPSAKAKLAHAKKALETAPTLIAKIEAKRKVAAAANAAANARYVQIEKYVNGLKAAAKHMRRLAATAGPEWLELQPPAARALRDNKHFAPQLRKDDHQEPLAATPARKTKAPKVQEPQLAVVHNLSAAGLQHAHELGGLPAPSLAVVHKDHGMDNFGEISLVAHPQSIDPARTPVFNADVYSPRWPRAKYRINAKPLSQIKAWLKPYVARVGGSDHALYSMDEDIERRGHKEVGNPHDVEARRAFGLAFLEEKGHKLPEGQRPKRLEHGWVTAPAMQAFLQEHGRDVNARPGEPYYAKLSAAAVQAVRQHAQAQAPEDPELAKDLEEAVLERHFTDGQLDFNRHHGVMQDASKVGQFEPDPDVVGAAVEAGLEPYAKEFEAWKHAKVKPAEGAPYIQKGENRKAAYTLENVFKELTKKVRGAEGFNYGLGSARSLGAKKFRSLEGVRAEAGKIVSKEEMARAKEHNDERLLRVAADLAPHHDRWRDGKAFGQLDDLVNIIGDSYRGKPIARELAASGYKNVPHDKVQAMQDLASDLLAMPTEYFEAKPQRIMPISEFKAAVVPHDVSPETLAVLKHHGIDHVERYERTGRDETQRASRAAAIARAAAAQKLMLSEGPEEQETTSTELLKWVGCPHDHHDACRDPDCTHRDYGAELAKMAVKDLQPGAKALNGSYDYSHLLTPEHRAAGYTMQVVPYGGGTSLAAGIYHRGTSVGEVTGTADAEEGLGIDGAEVDPGHRGKGLGAAAYEALMAHSYHHLGARHVYGDDHSTAAHALHQKLARKHGLNYRATPGYFGHEADGDDGEDFDGAYGPYQYRMKSEVPMDKAERPDLGHAALDEHGVHFETGHPVTFPFVRNAVPSPNFGERYQQHIDVAGRYLSHDPAPHHPPPPGWIKGQVSFRNPLVLHFNTGPDFGYNETSWKARLHQAFGAKGPALARKLAAAGHDGVVTVMKGGTGEIVDLTHLHRLGKAEPAAPADCALVLVQDGAGRILLGKRRDNGKWTLPAGHLDPGEAPLDGARRELQEEAGLVPEHLTFSRTLPLPNGASLHCFTALAPGFATNAHDPDAELDDKGWQWIDVRHGVPQNVWDNLHGPAGDANFLRQVYGLKKGADTWLDAGFMDLRKAEVPWTAGTHPAHYAAQWADRMALSGLDHGAHDWAYDPCFRLADLGAPAGYKAFLDAPAGPAVTPAGHYLEAPAAPVVLVHHPEHGLVPVDGAARIAAARAQGVQELPAVIGTPRLAKMAVKDIAYGQEIGAGDYGATRYNYSHALQGNERIDPSQYRLEVHHNSQGALADRSAEHLSYEPEFKAVLLYGGQRVGDVKAYRKRHKLSAIEPHSALAAGHQGVGLGRAMYEALYAHAMRHAVTQVMGDEHTEAAGRVHDRLAEEHGLDYAYDEGERHPRGSYDYYLKGELAKAETEVGTLLAHPDHRERALALKLGTATPHDLCAAILDPHPAVFQAALHHPDSHLALQVLAAHSRDASGAPLFARHDELLLDPRCTEAHRLAMVAATSADAHLPVPLQAARLAILQGPLSGPLQKSLAAQKDLARGTDPNPLVNELHEVPRPEHHALKAAFDLHGPASMALEPHHEERVIPETGSFPKAVYRLPVAGHAEPQHLMAKAYHAKGTPLAGWAEATSQDLYHAAGIGHLHQQSFVTMHGAGDHQVPATVIRIEPAAPLYKKAKQALRQQNPGIAEDARRVGLLDFLTHNVDRHRENLMVRPDGSLLAIDHGTAFDGDVKRRPESNWKVSIGDLIEGHRDAMGPEDHANEAWHGSVRWAASQLPAMREAFRQRLPLVEDMEARERLHEAFEQRAQHLERLAAAPQLPDGWMYQGVPLRKPLTPPPAPTRI